MDNLNELQKALLLGAPAVDDYLGHVGTGDFIRDVTEIRKEETFTKLEKASLIIAAGMVGGWIIRKHAKGHKGRLQFNRQSSTRRS